MRFVTGCCTLLCALGLMLSTGGCGKKTDKTEKTEKTEKTGEEKTTPPEKTKPQKTKKTGKKTNTDVSPKIKQKIESGSGVKPKLRGPKLGGGRE